MAKLTAFSWGYWGWGNHTEKLLAIVDSIETGRGFRPPIFVDTRIHRAVRAKGFRGNAFAETAGEDRYRWIGELGNRHAIDDKPGIRIDDPHAILELLSIVAVAQKDRRRVIFFCGCYSPDGCHRHTVRSLLLDAAKRNDFDLTVVEWPGGNPGAERIDVVDRVAWRKVLAAKEDVPLPELPRRLHRRLIELPWGSIVRLRHRDEQISIVSGHARYRMGRWEIPIFTINGGIDPLNYRSFAITAPQSFAVGNSPLVA